MNHEKTNGLFSEAPRIVVWRVLELGTGFRALVIHALFCAVLFSVQAFGTEEVPDQRFKETTNGLLLYPREGESKEIRINAITDRIIRVTAAAEKSPMIPPSIMVIAKAGLVDFEVKAKNDNIQLETDHVLVDVSLQNGRISFFNSQGKPLLSSIDSGRYSTVSRDPGPVDDDSRAIRQLWHRDSDEALYGLGQQQNGQVNLAGENVYMTTQNLVITIPYLVSSKNYGILWDNNSDSHFGKPESATPLFENLVLFDINGNPGGLTARYFDGETLLFERVEKDLNYQFLSHNSIREIPLPAEVEDAKDLRVEWQGSVASEQGGAHEFLMYSSGYAALALNGKEVLNRWRMNWNPWFHNVRVNLVSGERKTIKLDWKPQGGYFRLLHQGPSTNVEQNQISIASDTGKAIDYYFVAGDSADDLISGYRHLTGKAVMLPRWAYGFWQSRERYKSQDELLAVLKEYRDRKIPIDNIVLDWSYWPVDAWGSHEFDPVYFPDPEGMVNDVHAMNAQIMISVWPKFYPTTNNYKELNAQGFMLNRNIEDGNLDWISPGYLNAFYDAYNPDARSMFWRQVNEKLNVLGFDAWWMDAVEPDMHSNVSWKKRKQFMTPNFLGNGAEVFNAYAVPHAESIYHGDRAASPDKRVFILTRSGFGGIQRSASAIWSGDTVSRWSNLKEQIAAGIGTGLAGVPNWTFDIGGFTPEDRFRYNWNNKNTIVGSYADMRPEQLAEWQELNTRWYQFGAFVPLYRSHGQNPYREIFNIAAENSEVYKSLVWYTKLRYRLLPYIYSQAGDLYHKDATLMRGLVMDFPQDKRARDINDQYMFGPAFLVAPVYRMGATSRPVYLPAGVDWIDFYTGKKFSGGQSTVSNAPLGRMPLFVKAGSIVVTGPEVQYSDQVQNADLTINVFTGADGKFELYEDDGRSYGYETGEWSRIPINYNEAQGKLSIGNRVGSFEGMETQRTIKIRWIDEMISVHPTDFDKGIATTLNYDGSTLEIKRNH